MAKVVITIKIMPVTPEIDLAVIETKAKKAIEEFGAEWGKTEIEPIAFGLKALKLIIISDEEKGSTDALEEEIVTIEGVQSAEVTDVRRAIG